MIDRSWTVQNANASGRRLLGRVSAAFPFDRPANTANMLDITFSPDGIRPLIAIWDDYARPTIQRIHRDALSRADLRAAPERIGQYPDLPTDWWTFDVRDVFEPVFPIRIRTEEYAMNFFLDIAAIATPTDALAQELRVETLFPADDATESILRAAAH